MGEVRRAEEDPVVLWDPTGKGGVGFMSKRDEDGSGATRESVGIEALNDEVQQLHNNRSALEKADEGEFGAGQSHAQGENLSQCI